MVKYKFQHFIKFIDILPMIFCHLAIQVSYCLFIEWAASSLCAVIDSPVDEAMIVDNDNTITHECCVQLYIVLTGLDQHLIKHSIHVFWLNIFS